MDDEIIPFDVDGIGWFKLLPLLLLDKLGEDEFDELLRIRPDIFVTAIDDDDDPDDGDDTLVGPVQLLFGDT